MTSCLRKEFCILIYSYIKERVLMWLLVLLLIFGKCWSSLSIESLLLLLVTLPCPFWFCPSRGKHKNHINIRTQAHQCSMPNVLLWASRIKQTRSPARKLPRLVYLYAYTVSQSQRVAADKPVLPISALQYRTTQWPSITTLQLLNVDLRQTEYPI